MKLAMCLSVLLIVVSCGNDSNSNTESTENYLPTFNISCATPATACANNSANGKRVSAGWYLENGLNLKAAGGAYLTCSNGVCTANISDWTIKDGKTTIPDGNYTITVCVDMNNNGCPNETDPEATDFDAGYILDNDNIPTTLTVDNWINNA
jgi:hypothetical protein